MVRNPHNFPYFLKLTVLLLLVAMPYVAKCQLNMLNKSEDDIKDRVKRVYNGYFQKATYTDAGVRVLFFTFALDEPGGMMMATFFMSEKNTCTMCIYTYKDDSILGDLIKNIKADPNMQQQEGKLVFANYQAGYYIKVVREKEDTVSVAFNLIK